VTRSDLEHIIRAAGTIADVEDLIVIGSQAVLGGFPDAPTELLVSNEADVFPRGYPERSDLIDATIGQGSPFQNLFDYYAHGVDETTAILPDGWRDRLVLISGENTRFIRGWCLEIHDLAQRTGRAQADACGSPDSKAIPGKTLTSAPAAALLKS
jgi:hypothetical protein